MRLDCKIAAIAASLFLAITLVNAALPAGYTGTVFTGDTLKGHPQGIPGVVKGVFFDQGGEGVGYHDGSPGNTGGTMRPDPADINVDMQPFTLGTDLNTDGSNADTGSWHLSWIDVGDWERFTVHVNTAGEYNISTYQAVAGTPNTQTISFNEGTPITISNLAPTSTPAGHEIWHNWGTFPNVATVTLDTGLCLVQFTFVTASFNFDKLIFALKGQTGTNQAATARSVNTLGVKAVVSDAVLTATFTLPTSGLTKISVVDCLGRTVIAGEPKNMASGMQSEVIGVGTIGKGVYFVHLEHNSASAVVPFSAVR